MACFEADRFDEARKYLSHKLKTSGDDPEVLNLLGLVESKSGNDDAAIRAYKRAVKIAPNMSKAWNNLGNEYLLKGQYEKSLEFFQRAVAAEPANTLALENLAEAELKSGNENAAVAAYEELSRRAPDNAAFHERVGTLCMHVRAAEAEMRLRRAADLEPDDLKWQMALATFLSKRRRDEESLEIFARILAAHPGHREALSKRAQSLKILGRTEEAEAVYRHLLTALPADPRPLKDISELKRFRVGDPDIAVMESYLEDPEQGTDACQALRFGLAKAYHDLREYDRAFAHLREANRLKRQRLTYDVRTDVKGMRKLCQIFSPELMKKTVAPPQTAPVPIFIIGMPRSGTTLVEQILASHPEVGAGGEMTFMAAAFRGYRSPTRPDLLYPDWIAKTGDDDLKAFMAATAAAYLTDLQSLSPDAAYVTDKMPLNFLFLGLIAMALPQAKFVHCVRDPMDTCFSCYQQEFSAAVDFAWDLSDLAKFYQAYQDLMAHWNGELGRRIYQISYEKLVADAEPQTRQLLDACGLPWDQRCLEYYKSDQVIATASFLQARKPVYQESVQKWRSYKEHLAPLMKGLGVD